MAFAIVRGLIRKNLKKTYKQKSLRPISKRYLNIHENYSKDILAKHGVRVQKGYVVSTASEARASADIIQRESATNNSKVLVKALVLAGGRGKGIFNTGFKGGVHVVDGSDNVEKTAKEMLGNNLITKQNGPDGQRVDKLILYEGVKYSTECYLALLMDPSHQGPVIVGSPSGGMNIEEVARDTPDKIKTIPIPISEGLSKAKGEEMAKFLGFKESSVISDCAEQLQNLYETFMKNDCTQVEINPMVQITSEGYNNKIYSLDAKLKFDDSAQFRQKEIFKLKDISQEDPREIEAEKADLNYVGLDGNIGCMVNGAGLAMSTMDVIKAAGGEPANFLDVGGGANEEQVESALKILTNDKKVKGILINIFGGIMKCDVIARGVVGAAKTINLKELGIPLVVRLAGTNVEEGKKILNQSGLLIQSANDLDDAADKIVKAIANK